MKKIIILLLITCSLTSFGQETNKVEQYCELTATPRLLSNRVTIDVDYGEERSIWKDNRMKDEDGKLKKFNSTIDALNFMGKAGWKLVNAFPVLSGTTMVYHYVFKKEFLKSETEQ